MEEYLENGMELYCQDSILLVGASANYIQYINTPGTLSIVEYPNTNCTRYIEWKPNDITIESDDFQDQEWAMVNTVERRNRTLSGSSPPDSMSRSRVYRLNLKEVKSFRVSRNNQKISFNDKHGKSLCSFSFQRSNALYLTAALRNGLLKAVPSKDRHLFIVIDQPDNLLENSFAELNLFPEQSADYVWSFLKNLHNRPYETTMEAFSKLTDIVYRPPELPSRIVDEEVSELLNRSLTQIEEDVGDATRTTTTTTQDEYEVVAQYPILPPRPQIPRGNPLSLEQWNSLLDAQGTIQDVEGLKQVIFRGGIQQNVRNRVWKYLLGYYPWDSTREQREQITKQKSAEYFNMKLQWRSMSPIQENHFSDYRDRKSLIEKDVNRTDRTIAFYAGDDNPNLGLLSDILMTYVMYNFDLGYVQGMSDLLSPILCLMHNEVETFWCFAGFMDRVCNNFDMDQAGMKDQLTQLHALLSFAEPELANYLNLHDSGNMFFCFRWLLVLFKREFTQDDIMRLWEVIWTGLPCKNFHLLLCVAILDTEKHVLIENNYGFTEILKHVNDLSLNINLENMLSKAEGIYHQITAAAHLTDSIRVILGLKPVGDGDQHDSNVTSSIEEEDTSIENVTIKPDLSEVAFEASLSHSYL